MEHWAPPAHHRVSNRLPNHDYANYLEVCRRGAEGGRTGPRPDPEIRANLIRTVNT